MSLLGLVVAGSSFAVPAAAQQPIRLVVDGAPVQPAVAPQIIDGRTMVPLRFVAQALGAQVAWNAATRTVSIDAPASGSGFDVPTLVEQLRPSIVGVLALSYDSEGNPVTVSTGSGVVLSADGLVVTNAHVVAPSEFTPDAWYVEFAGGRTVKVPQRDIFADTLSDLAFIRTGVTGLTPAPLGDSSQVVVGEPVIAIGNPLGYSLRDTVTSGIVSGVGRYLPGGQFYYPFIQTDAAINPGNSGGALVDDAGQVIGITSVKLAATQGLGFAIPSDIVGEILKQYQATGEVERPWLGVSLGQPWQESYGLPTTSGLTVGQVVPGSPAAKAGVQVGDQILAVDGQTVHTVDGLIALLWSDSIGTTVNFTIERDGSSRQLPVALAARPANLSALRGGAVSPPVAP